MPTYDYRCDSCKEHHEAFQKITDEPLLECPKCHEKALKRMISSGASFLFKGSGFYCTDYKDAPNSTGCCCNPNVCSR